MLINLFLYIFFIYLAVFSVYSLIYALGTFKSKRFLANNKPVIGVQKKFCIIIHATSKSDSLLTLLGQIDSQNYPKALYQTHVIFQGKDDTIPDYLIGAKIWRLQNPDLYGKDKSISVLIEKLLPQCPADTYVFLGENRKIHDDFLVNIAGSISLSGVYTGRNDVFSKTKNLKANIFGAYQKYTNNTICVTRKMFGLYEIIDSENCVITVDILEKISSVSFETRNKELKYSVFLTSKGFPVYYNPFMRTYTDVANFEYKTPSLKEKITLGWYYLPNFVEGNWRFKELFISIMSPSASVQIFLFGLIAYFSFIFYFPMELKNVSYLGSFLLLNFLLGWFNSKLTPKDSFFITLFPIAAVISKLKTSTKRVSLKKIKEQNDEDETINQITVKVAVLENKKTRRCLLDLISEGGMSKAVLRFKKKKVSTDTHLRMYDAINDVSRRLRDKNCELKICQNCNHFQSQVDGSLNMVKGICGLHVDRNTRQNLPTLLWNTCMSFNISDTNSVIDEISQRMD